MTPRAARLAAAALAVVLVLPACGLGQDVEEYVGKTYTRSAGLDDGTAHAYTAGDPPAAAAHRISTAQRPLDTLTGVGRSASYLQYRDRIVRVAPAAAGSVILVDSYANGYQRWANDVAPRWGAVPPDDDDDDFGK